MLILLIAICLYIVYYAQGMGLPSMGRYHRLKKSLWVFRAIIVVLALLLAISNNQQNTDFAQFFAMFALANSLALPYRRNAVSKPSDGSVFEGLISKIAFSVGSSIFLLIVSFVALKVSTVMHNEEYWYAIVILFGCVGLYANESGLSEIYAQMDLGDRVGIDIRHRNSVLPIACLAYLIGSTLLAVVLFNEIDLQFGNWTGWSGLLVGAVVGGLFELD